MFSWIYFYNVTVPSAVKVHRLNNRRDREQLRQRRRGVVFDLKNTGRDSWMHSGYNRILWTFLTHIIRTTSFVFLLFTFSERHNICNYKYNGDLKFIILMYITITCTYIHITKRRYIMRYETIRYLHVTC